MKKVLFTFALAALFIFNNAIGQSFEKGNSALNLGIGIAGNSAGNLGLGASYEVGLFPVGNGFGVIGIGALVNYTTEKNSGVRATAIGLAPRGTFHFTVIPVEKLDVYAAVEPLTVVIARVKFDGNSVSDSDVDLLSISAGARYFFSENMAAFVETGSGFNYLTGGITLKF